MPFTPPDTDEILQAWSPPDEDELVTPAPQMSLSPSGEIFNPRGEMLGQASAALAPRFFEPEGTLAQEAKAYVGEGLDRAAEKFYDVAPNVADFTTGVVQNLTPAGILNTPTRLENIARGYLGADQVPLPFESGRPFIPIKEPEGTGFGAGLGKLAARNINALQTPEMLVTGPIVANPLGRLAFAEEMGTHLPSSVEASAIELGSNLNPTAADWTVGVGQPLIEAGLTTLLSKSPKLRPLEPERPAYDVPSTVEVAALEGGAPVRRLGVDVPPNPFFNPGVRELATAALEEAQGRRVLRPGEEPAIETLRRAVEPPQVIEAPSMFKPEPLGGQVSFAAPAEARIIPSGRQAAIESVSERMTRLGDRIVSRQREAIGVTGPDAPSYRRPQSPPTKREAELRQQRENIERGLEGPATQTSGSTELPFAREGQFPVEGMPTGTLSKLQRERMLAGKTNVRSSVRNNPPAELISKEAVNWADKVIRESKGRVYTGVDPQLIAAYAVKGAKIVETGVRDFAEWSSKMVDEFGASIKQHLQSIWDEINGGKGKTDPRQEIDRFVKMDAAQFDQAIKDSKIGLTSMAYRLGEKLKTEDIPLLETAQKTAHEQRKAATKSAKTPDEFGRAMALGMKGQMFNEAIKWRRALDEAKRNKVTMQEDFAALERKHGVGESNRFGGDLRDALQRELKAESLSETLAKNAEQKTSEFTSIDPTKQQLDVIKSEAVLSNKLGETSHETIGSMSDVELNKVFDSKKQGGSVQFPPHTDGVAYGLKHPELVKELEHLRDTATKAAMDAGETGNNSAFQANFGRMTWAAGALEGALKKGPNYELFKKSQNEKAPTLQEKEVIPEVESVTSLDPQSGVALSATDALINKLEGLKFTEANIGRLYSLPHPEVIVQIGKTAWNNGIDVAIGAIKAGKAIKEAVNEAISYIKKNAQGKFDEGQTRRNLENILENERVSPSSEPRSRNVPADKARPEASEASRNEAENVRMRNLSARGTQAEAVPKPVQEKIANAPESFYKQQSMAKVEEAVKGMTDQDLAAVPKESDIYTAAKLEQATRLFDAGKNDAGYNVYQELSTELTRLGQVINQAKLLTGLRPENVVKVVNEGLKKAGKDVLTPEQSTRVLDASKQRVEAQRRLDQATDAWLKDPSDANAVKAEEALLKSNEAALGEQRLTHRFQDRSMAALLKSILQGNLLTPISQVANIVGNINFLPFRSATRTGAAVIDMIDATIRNRPREVSVSPTSGTKAAVEGAIKGLKKVPDIMMRGTGDAIKGETRAGLHPLRAWVTQLSKNPDAPTVNGRIPLIDRVKLAIEGTLGVPAELMLRGLGSGDIAFREAARARLISEHSRLKSVPEGQRRMAQSFPELFFDRETMKRIDEETLGAIFQRHSKTLDHLLSWTKSKGDLMDFAIATVAPYKMTPWNIVGEILSYNPAIALGKTINEARKGNTRAAEMNAAKIVVGGTLIGAGMWLYDKGLLAPSMDSRNEQQKARILAGEVLPPNHINISGLKRALAGGDPAFQPGDETRDIFRGGGLAGAMFYLVANTGRDRETAEADDNIYLDLLKNSTLEQARFGLNQSFLKGVVGVLDAVREGEADNLMQSYAGTVLSVPLPNTLSSISRAQREYKVDASSDKTLKQLENVVRTRLGAFGLDDYLPLKRGLWGEPLRERPADSNALIREFFDISKKDQVTDDPVALELYRLWRKTANTSVIPTPPEKTFTFARQTYNLTPEQRSRYAELVGTARRDIVDRMVVNPSFHNLPDEGKIKMLNRVYEMGLEMGRAKFWMESGGQLTEKPEKAGFR